MLEGEKEKLLQMEQRLGERVIGQKEADAQSVAVRSRARGDEGVMTSDAFVTKLKTEVTTRALPNKKG